MVASRLASRCVRVKNAAKNGPRCARRPWRRVARPDGVAVPPLASIRPLRASPRAARRRPARPPGSASPDPRGRAPTAATCPTRTGPRGSPARICLARTESSSIGVTARRPPRNVTARAPAWPSLIRACCSEIRFAQRLGQLAEAVLELVAQRHQVGDLARAGDPAVHVDLGLLVGDVVRRHVRVDVDVEAHRLPVLVDASPSSVGRRTASSSICMYSSNPSAATWPDCSSPSRLPAPRISRSRIAILKPAPSSV